MSLETEAAQHLLNLEHLLLPVSLSGLSVEGSEKEAVTHWQSDEWHIYNF